MKSTIIITCVALILQNMLNLEDLTDIPSNIIKPLILFPIFYFIHKDIYSSIILVLLSVCVPMILQKVNNVEQFDNSEKEDIIKLIEQNDHLIKSHSNVWNNTPDNIIFKR